MQDQENDNFTAVSLTAEFSPVGEITLKSFIFHGKEFVISSSERKSDSEYIISIAGFPNQTSSLYYEQSSNRWLVRSKKRGVEREKKGKVCCFTGHRPEKILASPEEVKASLKAEIEKAIHDGYTTFISGGARGVDLWSAGFVLEEKKQHPELKLVMAIPFPEFERNWDNQKTQSQNDRRGSVVWNIVYKNIIEQADEVVYISEQYSKECFQKRNMWMVDRSDLVIAVYNGHASGTRNTIEYAKRRNVPINMIDLSK